MYRLSLFVAPRPRARSYWSFFASFLEGMSNESWGLDNILVELLYVTPDFDKDSDVDEDDRTHPLIAHRCRTRATAGGGGCETADLDLDGDVDEDDLAFIDQCWSGPGVATNPACEDQIWMVSATSWTTARPIATRCRRIRTLMLLGMSAITAQRSGTPIRATPTETVWATSATRWMGTGQHRH